MVEHEGSCDRLRIAYFSPLSPIRSGISGYSEELIPELARHCQLDLFVDGYQPTNVDITTRYVVRDASMDTGWRDERYDLAMYHIGNNPYHSYMLRALRQRPGVVVFHDAVLHHLLVEETLAKENRAAYVREMGYAYGREGVALALRVARGEREIPHFQYPLLDRVVDLSFGVVVHSQYARSLVERTSPGKLVRIVPLFSTARTSPQKADRERARQRLGLEPNQFILASFGFATPAKRVEVALRAFRRFLEKRPGSRFLWVGEYPGWCDVPSLVCQLGLGGRASVTGYVDDETFSSYISATDVCLALRYPTAGETSAALLHLMAMAKPTVVTDTGWFSELPADCCLKVGVGPGEEDDLVATLERLADDGALRARLGKNARQHVLCNHRLEEAARGYAEFLGLVWQEVVT